MTTLKTATTMFAKRIRERDGRCMVADWLPAIACNGNLQCSHLLGVGAAPNLRYQEWNALAACAAHHWYTTNHQHDWEDAIDAHYALTYNQLRDLRRYFNGEKPADAVARMRLDTRSTEV